jgi:serine phosphatase RsbU (regulator of sigma subunit)
VVLETTTGLLTYANGGHNYPLLFETATGQVSSLRAQGIVLGIIDEPQFEQQSTTMLPGDVLLLYTDGVTEAMNPQRELFGDDRLAAVLRANHHRAPQEILNAVLTEVTAFAGGQSQADDITMVVIKRAA